MLVGIITFPGTIDAPDVKRALNIAGVEAAEVRHTETDLSTFDALIIPGGKSYGDYLRPGALAQTAPVITALVAAANDGKPVLGIGNGFQILLEAGLLEGALSSNENLQFVRTDATIKFKNTASAWTKEFEAGEEIVLPLRANYAAYTATDETLAKLKANDQIVASYSAANPAGGSNNIAAIRNPAGNVLGIITHPEFAVEPGFGPDTSSRMRSGVDGLRFFSALISS